MIEIKIVMALTLRSFDVVSAYEELDKLSGSGRDAGYGPKWNSFNTAEGERAYQVLLGSGKPVDGMPARVTRRELPVTR